MTLCLASFFLAVSPGPFAHAEAQQQDVATPGLDQLRAEHQRVLEELNKSGAKGQPLSLDDPRASELLKRGWTIAGAWAAAYLENHPTPSNRELEHIFDGFAPEPQGVKSEYGDFLEYREYNFSGRAVRIGEGIYVVESHYFRDTSTGTFMVVARNHDGHFQALWNIKDLAEKHYAQRGEIGRWLYLVSRAYYNGPLDVGKVLPLPPLKDGHARFLVNAFQSADGGTIGAQLSIWEWDGAEAKPLLVKLYQYAVDFGSLRFDGRIVRILTKEGLGTLFSCGECATPRGVWTIRITPDGVQDLGHRFLTPEIQWADELLSKIEKGEDASGLAGPEVIAALKAETEDAKSEDLELDPSRQRRFNLGMIERCRVVHRGQQGAFEIDLDEAKLRFSYVMRNGKHYFTHVRIQ
jgi:hypothetical protein